MPFPLAVGDGSRPAGGYSPSSAASVPGQVVPLQTGPVQTDATNNQSAVLYVAAPANLPVIPGQPATPVIATATGATGAQAVATMAGVAGKTNYLTGLVITSDAPAAVKAAAVTLAGLLGGTITWNVAESTAAGLVIKMEFPVPLPASAANTAIVLTFPAVSSGGNVSVTLFGFVQ